MIPLKTILAALIIYSILLLFEIFLICVEPINAQHIAWNLLILPGWQMFILLTGAGLLTPFLLRRFKSHRPQLGKLAVVFVLIAAGTGILRELYRWHQIHEVFNDDPEIVQFVANRKWDVLRPAPPELRETIHIKKTDTSLSPDGKYYVRRNGTSRPYLVNAQTKKHQFTLDHWLVCDDMLWFSGSKYIVYEYSGDRSDPMKIFGANIVTGQTILLGGILHSSP